MTTSPRAKPSGREILAARARRVSAIRRRVTAAALASFALAWGAIVWDGSMGATTTTTATTPAVAVADSTAASSTDSTASSATDEPAAVTTSQS